MGTTLPLENEIMDAMAATVGAWMRDVYPRNTAKLAARALGTSHHTTIKILKGKLPENRLLVKMILLWGKDFSDRLLEPALSVTAIEADIRTLRGRNLALKAEIQGELNVARGRSASVTGSGVDLGSDHGRGRVSEGCGEGTP